MVQRHEKETIRKDPVMKARVVASYELMLDFYGLKLTDREKGTVEREDNWVDRFHNLNTRHVAERPTLLPQETNTRPHLPTSCWRTRACVSLPARTAVTTTCASRAFSSASGKWSSSTTSARFWSASSRRCTSPRSSTELPARAATTGCQL